MKISIKIRKLRDREKVSQAEVADELQVSQAAYNKWETGSTMPSLENIIKLCNYYNIGIAELLDDNFKILSDDINKKGIRINEDFVKRIIQNQEKLIELTEIQNGILIQILKCNN
ncbi:helix-turn-helix transcriptional regulator [Elizabethkingia anophelis]|uniref:Cro/Cl family transcriptional regulator n=1 Tax=Elizabethkingia anophelis TaxID=1117645 RepID=A0AAU8UU11_9FLAO|nr:helix-turn-helix transcriptional regulator [Elizabethkingia anophelis]AQW93477.1 Cro/Cl family transcriptional regulator [Elizabethkingia anophelis]AQX01783.1 Cro/Cl family transcriptional regulator [Elizabethkingia anophelis]KFC33227.1 Cro/Cl family transcriptional regulator [Elizabethkingia anophelis]MCL1035212.1 helix-turn-helix transcriptional regulator [Elizabethkingia anophelis]MCT3734774.1 helix-turn-helix transcriptional regulator [Elizabethkingia anophelis]